MAEVACRLRVLLLEDDPLSAEMGLGILRREWPDLEPRVAATREDFERGLSEFRPELILADYQVPGFDGLEALELAKAAAPGVPFILVSGTVGEEFAIEAMRRGATDYVLKHRLEKLPVAAARALKEARERETLRRTEEALRRNDATLRTAMGRVSDAFVALDRESQIVYINSRAAELLGKTAEVLVGQVLWGEFPDGGAQGLQRGCERALKEQQPLVMEDYFTQWKRWFEGRIYPSPHGLTIFLSDVTDRRQVQENYRALIEATNTGFMVLDAEGRVVDANAEYVRLSGHSRVQDIRGRPVGEWVALHDRERAAAEIELCLRLGATKNLELDYAGPEGALTPVEISAAVTRGPEGPRIIGICRDIGARKRMEAALRESERRLATALGAAEERVVLLEEQSRARAGLGRLVGKSPIMQEVYRRLRLAADSDVTVLLTGESGVGKELAAAAIHSRSHRAKGPLIAVNCAAIPETLLESELFGHVKGAFTGAVRDKTGLFQAAHGGTLFLDEIGDMPPLLQVKVLRALETHEVRRVGDDRPIRVDVRIISATNRNLDDLLKDGRIREDFYYRIRVFEIAIPPLRERTADLPLLVDQFLADLSRDGGKRVSRVSPEAMRRILGCRWPGNVRELRNALEIAFVNCAGGEIQVSDLPPQVRPPSGDTPHPGAQQTRESDERERIAAALRQTAGAKAEAARKLGISRVTLWKRMKRYGLD